MQELLPIVTIQLFSYFHLQAGSKCYCDDDYGKHGKSMECTEKCEDETSVYSLWCGGEYANFVYKIGGRLCRYRPVVCKINLYKYGTLHVYCMFLVW